MYIPVAQRKTTAPAQPVEKISTGLSVFGGVSNSTPAAVIAPPAVTPPANFQTIAGKDVYKPMASPSVMAKQLQPFNYDSASVPATISQGEPSTLNKVTAKLPSWIASPVRTIAMDISDGLFGNAKDKAALNLMEEQGHETDLPTSLKVNGLVQAVFPTLGQSNTDRIDSRAKSLMEKGVDEKRATELAFYDVFAGLSGTPGSKQATLAQQAKDRLVALKPTSSEKNSLMWSKIFNVGGEALDIGGVLPIGAITRGAGLVERLRVIPNTAEGIAEAQRLLTQAGVAEDIAKTAAPKFAELTDSSAINAGLDSIEKLQNTTKAAYTPIAQSTNTKLEQMAQNAGNFDEFYNRSGVGMDSLNATAVKKGYKDAQDFYEQNHRTTPTSPEEAAQIYKQRVITPAQQKGEAVVIGADDMKDYFGKDYNDANHPTYSKASYQLFQQALEEVPDDSVIFTGGGPGSGKTEGLINVIKDSGYKGIVYDSNLSNYEGALKQIEDARAAGKHVSIYGVTPNLDKARGYTMLREARTGRAISDKTFARGHTGFPAVVAKLIKEGVIDAEDVHILDTRNIHKVDEMKQLAKTGAYVKDPLAHVKGLGYNEANVGETYTRERYSSVGKGGSTRAKNVTRNEQTPVRFGADRASIKGGRVEIDPELASLERASQLHKAEEIPKLPKAPPLSPAARAALDAGDLNKLKTEIEQAKLERSFNEEAAANSGGKELQKYESRATGQLPEVTGKDTVHSVNDSKRVVKNSKFGKQGDQLVTELGFSNPEEAQKALDDYKNLRQWIKSADQSIRDKVKNYHDRKAVFDEVVRFVNQQGRARRERVSAVQEFFKFNEKDMRDLMKGERDVRLMSDDEFGNFMKKLEGRATEQFIRRQALNELNYTILDKELTKVENLRKALKLPKVENMSVSQIRDLDQFMQQFKQGDEFLSVRKLETIGHTDLKGIHTIREAREKLLSQVNKEREIAGKAPVTMEDLNNIKVAELDRYRYDTALARRNPLYELMVQEKNKAVLTADMNVMHARERVDELFNAARKSRKRGLIDRAIPTDNLIFRWLESPDEDKLKMAKDMTAEELEAGMYIRDSYAEMRGYLAQQKVLKRYISDYVTHIRRGFLEAWKEGGDYTAGSVSGEKPGKVKRFGQGLLAGFRESFQKYVQDEAYFNIMDQATDQVLPLEKFFQYSMRRTGELVPSKNVAKAYIQYLSTFEKKKALDSLIPKLDIYVHSLTPKKLTPRGLEFDSSLKKFFKEWMNTKKGRVTSNALVKPGGKIDWALRTGVALTRIVDLGLSVPVGIASNLGAQAAVYRGIGEAGYALGQARMFTKEGRAILENYKNFTGEPIRHKIMSSTASLGDNIMTGVFGLFSFADRKARQVFLLSKLTPEELKTGKIATDKLARLQTELGRHLPIEGAESIIGKTAVGKVFNQYKTWAVPLLSSTADDLVKLQKAVRTGDASYLKSPELKELLRTTIVSAVVGIAGYGLLTDKRPLKEMSFTEKMAVKAAQDAMSLVGALDPSFWTSQPRLEKFLYDIGKSITQIVTLQKNKSGEMTGVKGLATALTPGVVRQVVTTEQAATGGSSKGGLPKLPKLPKASGLPKLPKMPKI